MPQNDSPPRHDVAGVYEPNPPAAFVELGVTSAFSFLRGASQAHELVPTAHALGYDAIGIADLNSLAGVVRMHSAAVRAGMRPLIGARIELVCGNAFLAYPMDRAAYGRLSALISRGRRHTLDGGWQAKGVCELTLDDLAAHADGVQLIWLPRDRREDGEQEDGGLHDARPPSLPGEMQRGGSCLDIATIGARGERARSDGDAALRLPAPEAAEVARGRAGNRDPHPAARTDATGSRPGHAFPATGLQPQRAGPSDVSRKDGSPGTAPSHRSADPEGLSALPDLVRRLPTLRHIAACFRYRGDDVARINRLDRAARALGLSILATNDVHYHLPDRRPLQDVMTCIRHGTTIDRAGRLLHPNAERHLKSPAEMVRLFARWPHAIAATRQVADACHFSLGDLRYEYPRRTAPPGRDPQDYLQELTWRHAAERYPGGIPDKVRAALEKELRVIASRDFARYFLTVHAIVAYAHGQGILCQGRGSAANSAVCFVLGITPVDPAQHELLFERFINQKRDEPPDIDVDFEHERREEVIQHIYREYGRDRAGLCATVIHYRPRSAIREVGKAMGLSEDVTSALAGTVWGSWGDDLGHAPQAGLNLRDRRLAMTIRLAEQMIGMPRHLSQHVGGFILTEGPLTETVPIGNGAMPERSFIEWDKDDIDELRILKVDVLALGMLTCVRKCFDLIAAHHGRQLQLADLKPDAPDAAPVFEMLCRGDSVGVFQVESRAQMNMLPRLKPKCFYDLVIEVAIVRPGPIQGDMVHPYLRRRSGKEAVEFPVPAHGDPSELRDILGRTLGVPIFQEQAMKIAMIAARFDASEADELRKAMATFRSRGTIGALEDKMVGRMVERGYEEAFARRCFDQIKGFGEYGFPESHATAFAHLVYASAWLKHYYPDAFAAALLNSQPMGFYAPAQIVRDARAHGVELRAVDVNYSDWDNTLEPADGNGGAESPGAADGQGNRRHFALRLGLRQVDGLAQRDAARMVAARDAPFDGPADLHRRARLDMGALRRLTAADAFRSTGRDRRAALWDARALRDAPDLPLFAGADGEGADPPVTLPAMPVCEQVVVDYQTLRLSLKGHPMRFLRASLRRQGYVSAAELGGVRNGAAIRLAGLVLIRQRPGSANGVCFITLEDETGSANLVLWPKIFDAFRAVAMSARVIAVEGRIQRGEGVTHVIAASLTDRSDVLARLAGAGAARDGAGRGTGDGAVQPRVPPGAQPAPSHPRNIRVLPASRDFH